MRLLAVLLLAGGLAACQTTKNAEDVADLWQVCKQEATTDVAQAVFDSCTQVITQSGDPYFVSRAYNNRSLVYYDRGRYADAVADLDEAIRLDPDLSSAYHNRGRAYSMLGKGDLAVQDFEASLRLNPDSAFAHNNFAWHLAVHRDYAAAAEQASEAIALAPDSSDFLDTQAHVLMGLRRAEEAEAAFAKAIALGEPDLVEAYQRALQKKGYAPGRSDGVMDDATRAALRACIRDNCRLLLD